MLNFMFPLFVLSFKNSGNDPTRGSFDRYTCH